MHGLQWETMGRLKRMRERERKEREGRGQWCFFIVNQTSRGINNMGSMAGTILQQPINRPLNGSDKKFGSFD